MTKDMFLLIASLIWTAALIFVPWKGKVFYAGQSGAQIFLMLSTAWVLQGTYEMKPFFAWTIGILVSLILVQLATIAHNRRLKRATE